MFWTNHVQLGGDPDAEAESTRRIIFGMTCFGSQRRIVCLLRDDTGVDKPFFLGHQFEKKAAVLWIIFSWILWPFISYPVSVCLAETTVLRWNDTYTLLETFRAAPCVTCIEVFVCVPVCAYDCVFCFTVSQMMLSTPMDPKGVSSLLQTIKLSTGLSPLPKKQA